MIKLLCAVFVLFAAASSALAQTPGAPVNPMLGADNIWTGRNHQPWCSLAFNATLTSNANTCVSNPKIGSPHFNYVTLTGNVTSWPMATDMKSGEILVYRFIQDATGGRTVTIATNGTVTLPASAFTGSALTLTGTANSYDDFTCVGFGGTAPTWLATKMDCRPAGYNFVSTSGGNFVQAPFSALTSGSSPSTSVGATGSVVGNGDIVVGAVMYTQNAGDSLSTVTDDKGNTYALLDHVTDSSGHWFTTFDLYNITNGPSTITANFNSSTQAFSAQIIWAEYSGLGAGTIGGHTGQYQNNPGAGTNAITSGTATGSVKAVGFSTNGGAPSNPTAGTGFTLRAQDNTSASWGATVEDMVLSSSAPVAATFTDSAGASNKYWTSVITLHP